MVSGFDLIICGSEQRCNLYDAYVYQRLLIYSQFPLVFLFGIKPISSELIAFVAGIILIPDLVLGQKSDLPDRKYDIK